MKNFVESYKWILELAIILFQIFELYCVYLYFRYRKFFKENKKTFW